MFKKKPKARLSAEARARIKAGEAAIKAAQKQLAEALESARDEAPTKPGELIPVTGFSYKGKTMKVTEVFLQLRGGGPRWVARGLVLKNDDTPGLQVAENTWDIEKEEK